MGGRFFNCLRFSRSYRSSLAMGCLADSQVKSLIFSSLIYSAAEVSEFLMTYRRSSSPVMSNEFLATLQRVQFVASWQMIDFDPS